MTQAAHNPALLKPVSAESLANERFGFTLFISICAHVVLILGVGYSVLEKMDTESSLDITLAQYQSAEAPDEADFIAQANQLGSGSLEESMAPSTPIQSRFNAERIQDISPFIPEQSTSTQQPVLTVSNTENGQISNEDEEELQNDAELLPTDFNSDQYAETIASLQAQLDLRRQEYAKRPRKYTISSASTQQARDALYLDSWRKKIENVGNLNYPQQASQNKIYGSLRLLVALRPDGNVEEIRLLSSSGHSILDNAAIRIVELAAPFEPFPDEMKRDFDILEVIRTWQFHDSNSLRSF